MLNSLRAIKWLAGEVLLILLFAFTVNNYLGHPERTISADGIGYYDYLPSVFIHHDFFRKDLNTHDHPECYARLQQFPEGMYNDFDGKLVNKYPVGTALLEAPFFLYTWSTTTLDGSNEDGYQHSFQMAVYAAALFFLFLGLLFFRKLLQTYHVPWWGVLLGQILLVFSTNLFYYTGVDSGYSHVYSFFAVTAFLYVARRYFETRHLRFFLCSCALFGLIFLLRPVNILVVCALPLIAGSFASFKAGITHLFKNYKGFLLGLALLTALVSFQFWVIYAQSGSFLLYTYKGEGFQFLHPELYNILFSYRKGLFVYTPVLFLSLLSLIYWIVKKDYFFALSWLCFFAVLTYVLSSWWSWFYGCSFGQRPFIEFYALLILPLVLWISRLQWRTLYLSPFLAGVIYLNLVQSFQYRYEILDWLNMNEAKYWKVFLKTDRHLQGLFFAEPTPYDQYEWVHAVQFSDTLLPPKSYKEIAKLYSDQLPRFNEIGLIRVSFEHDFPAADNSRTLVEVRDSITGSPARLWMEKHLVHYAKKSFDQWQSGWYEYRYDPVEDSAIYRVLVVMATEERPVHVKNLRLDFFALRPSSQQE
jgi:hypothetical protein